MSTVGLITIPQRLRISPEQWQILLNEFACNLRVAMPAIVQNFNATKQTVDVKLALREITGVNIEVKVLSDIPIVIPRAGAFSLTLPIQAGDECLLVFADMSIDSWWESGGVRNQYDRSRHELSDAIAIMGCWSQPRVISSYSTTAAELRTEDGTVKVSLESNKVTVSAPTVDVTASSQVNITGNGHVSVEHKDFLTHQHTGVSTGGGTSGPVL